MICGIKGKAVKTGDTYVMIETKSGLSYKVMVSAQTAKILRETDTEEISLFTELRVREDGMDLFGFLTEEEKRFFEMLVTVSGVGPKAAMAILSIGPVDRTMAAIAEGKTEMLTKSFGIGKKTAERIVIELKDKVKKIEGSAVGDWDDDAYEALIKLGYRRETAREAMKDFPAGLTTEEKIREAIRKMK